jgi:hypothetical protein
MDGALCLRPPGSSVLVYPSPLPVGLSDLLLELHAAVGLIDLFIADDHAMADQRISEDERKVAVVLPPDELVRRQATTRRRDPVRPLPRLPGSPL